MKKVILLLLLCLFCLSVGKSLHHLKNGFSPRRIQSLSNRIDANWDQEVEKALEQPYYYLGRGRQCFAFESADQKYVLKFPRTDIYKIPFWVRALPLKTYRHNLEADKKEREEFILSSLDLSFHELKKETALLAIHLGQSEPKGKKLILFDKLGCRHTLPLDKAPFLLQYKKPILMKAFSSALQRGEKEEAKKILDALIDVIVDRASKGILNRDRSFLRNYGFDGERGYQIDIGSFFKNPTLEPKAAYIKSLYDSLDPIQEWLSKTDPEMLSYLNAKVDSIAIK